MTTKDLKNYRAICADIIQKKQMLTKDRQHVVDAVQTAAEFPYWKHTIPIEGDIWPYDPQPIQGLISRRMSEKAEIEEFVAGIENFTVKRAVEERYIVPLFGPITWDGVAVKIGYHGSGNALKQYVWQYLNNRNNTNNKSE